MKITNVESYTAKIYLGTKVGYKKVLIYKEDIKDFLQKYCDDIGLCINVVDTTFIYKNGREPGIIIELINYPRFPQSFEKLKKSSLRLTEELCEKFHQLRVSIKIDNKIYMVENTKNN